ncbi:RHS repeat-associated core domain-containing protein [Pseudomonas sp. BN607]|nr:RHS repeat-associated core domain-containing protein [Pseudomonas sp. BN607]
MPACRSFFYQRERLAVSTDPVEKWPSRILRHGPVALSCRTDGPQAGSTSLYKVDVAGSVHGDQQSHTIAYSPYGHRPECPNIQLGFNGECKDPVIGGYWLGNGKRVYSPILMRFFSPDDLSPFAEGGLNCYAYCQGDPVNKSDPTGRSPALLSKIDILFNVLKRAIGFMSGLRLPGSQHLRVKGFIMHKKGASGTPFTLKLAGDSYEVKFHPQSGPPEVLTGYRHRKTNTYFYVGKSGTPPRQSRPFARSAAPRPLADVAAPAQTGQSDVATQWSASESHKELLALKIDYAEWKMFNDPEVYAYVQPIRQGTALGNV